MFVALNEVAYFPLTAAVLKAAEITHCTRCNQSAVFDSIKFTQACGLVTLGYLKLSCSFTQACGLVTYIRVLEA